MNVFEEDLLGYFHSIEHHLKRIADALEKQNEIQAKKVRVFDSFSLIKFIFGKRIGGKL